MSSSVDYLIDSLLDVFPYLLDMLLGACIQIGARMLHKHLKCRLMLHICFQTSNVLHGWSDCGSHLMRVGHFANISIFCELGDSLE